MPDRSLRRLDGHGNAKLGFRIPLKVPRVGGTSA